MLYREGYKNVIIVDDNFTHKPERVERICDLIIEKKIRMRFYCEGRVNKASPGMLRKMKKAGFDVIFFGVESASARVLQYYRKGTTPEQIVSAVNNAKKAGMIVITSFIVGAPVEQKEDMEATVDFIRRLKPDGIEMNVLDVFIGTSLWDDLEKQGKIGRDDWKTNHRIYDFTDGDGHSHSELEQFARDGYNAYADTILSLYGITEISRLLLYNGTARSVVWGNLFNPNVIKAFIHIQN
jgi:radical SAM superfamily enzyme YgiQ (UPF0313 family)